MLDAVVVDDDASQLAGLAELVAHEGFRTRTAGSVRAGHLLVTERQPDLVLCDLVLPDGSGMDLLGPLDRRSKLILVTGHASVESAVDALRRGAADYLVKPIDVAALRAVLGRLGQPRRASRRTRRPLRLHCGHLVGESTAMRQVYGQIARVAGTEAAVLLVGESGTGKELIAQAIRDLSKRSDRPFIALNCGAMTPTLIESELFGHERGSFTGAAQRHHGHFERADGGTLFLDEISEMPIELQTRLLRVLETGTLLRVGGETPLATDVRVIAATNRSPEDAIRAGKLRADLYYRLSVFPIHLPPLRERETDIALLADHFLARLDTAGTAKHLSPEAIATLERHRWPGNVRELKNVMQRAFILAGDRREIAVLPQLDPARSPTLQSPITVGQSIESLERHVILTTLAKYRNRRQTAAALGISLKTLYNRLKQYSHGGACPGEATTA